MISWIVIIISIFLLQNYYVIKTIIFCITSNNIIALHNYDFITDILKMGLISILVGVIVAIINLIISGIMFLYYTNIISNIIDIDLIYSSLHQFTTVYILTMVNIYIVEVIILIIFELLIENTYVILLSQNKRRILYVKQYTRNPLILITIMYFNKKDEFAFTCFNNMIFVSESIYVFHRILKVDSIEKINKIVLNPIKEHSTYIIVYIMLCIILSIIYVLVSYIIAEIINMLTIKTIKRNIEHKNNSIFRRS